MQVIKNLNNSWKEKRIQLKKQEIIRNIENKILNLKEKHNLSFDEVLNILKRRKIDRKTKTLPLSIFNNKTLSSLETIVKYLKENLNLNYNEIATLLNRNYNPIAITYRNSKKKMPKKLDISSLTKIPIKIFTNRKLSILENLTTYLKEDMLLTYQQIATLLNRNYQTIWTCYHRALKKRGSK